MLILSQSFAKILQQLIKPFSLDVWESIDLAEALVLEESGLEKLTSGH